MLESVVPDLVVHQGSPTKQPAARLETIRAAGELKIPFTSGILVGIGETEDQRVEALEALAAVHADHGHLQEVILQNYVPHRRYYGEEPAEIATEAADAYWRTGVAAPPEVERPAWATDVSLEDMKRLVAETRRLMPDVGIQVPPNLADWWPELVAAGATDLGGLSANGDHISPEHPFPSPHQTRKRLQADGVALTERLCVYPQYIGPEWVAQGVLDVIKTAYWSFIPRHGSGRREERAIRRDLVPGGDRPRPRRRRAVRGGADGALRRSGAPRRSRTCARPPTSCAPSSRGTRSPSSSTATSTSRTSASSAAPSAASGRASARPTPTSTPARSSPAGSARPSRPAPPRSASSRASIPTGASRTTRAGCASPTSSPPSCTCTPTRRWRSTTCAWSPAWSRAP